MKRVHIKIGVNYWQTAYTKIICALSTIPPIVPKRPPRWKFTKPFRDKTGQKPFLRRLDRVRILFPEFEGETIKVGITTRADGKADLSGQAIYFRSRNSTNYTMAHELTHLLQGKGLVPGGERSCDIYTLARSVEFCDQAPNYLKTPRWIMDEERMLHPSRRATVHELAKEAVSRRSRGLRNYISWFEAELPRRCGQLRLDEF